MDTKEIDIIKIILDSGPVVKLVLLLLLAASVYSWAIIFGKKRNVRQLRGNNGRFMRLYLDSKNLHEVMQRVDILPPSPYRTMFLHGYKELVKIKQATGSKKKVEAFLGEHFATYGFGGIERALQKGVNEVNVGLDYAMSSLGSIGSITPFIGLFGTVWGIIDSFTELAGGGATLDAVAPGIAEALVATAIGLVAAIPAVWFFNHFTNAHRIINNEMESFGQEFLNVVERSLINTET